MDIGAFLAQLAVALSPYAAKGAEKAAEKIAEDVYGKAKGILSALRNRLRGKPEAERALAKYEAEPASPENQTALAETLQQAVVAQPDFQRELLALAQSLLNAVQTANTRGAKFQIVANQIIGAGDGNTFNFYGAPPAPPEQK
ncbi:MAG TPA: hypothetical protein VIK33_00135 [Anaerolineae bacterium]